MVTLKSSLLKLSTRVSSGYIEVITSSNVYNEVITSKAVNKGA